VPGKLPFSKKIRTDLEYSEEWYGCTQVYKTGVAATQFVLGLIVWRATHSWSCWHGGNAVPHGIVNQLDERMEAGLSMILARWVSTVLTVIFSCAAISLLDFPRLRGR